MDEDPSYDISVSGTDDPDEPLAARLQDAVAGALGHHQIQRARIALVVVDDKTMSALNEKHLNHAGPTDVLTFDLRGGADGTGHPEPWEVDGEVVVSRDTARREASDRTHDADAELALYAVHGTLHLLGYSDADPQASKVMHETEDKILTAIGLGAVYDGEGSR